jgi:phosphotransferase system HPr (HPr) family protein
VKSQKKCGAIDKPEEDVMIEKTVVVSMMGEAEERPVAVLVQVASQYDSKIYLVTGDKKINAKSIMGMMSMNFANGSEITIAADGQDEETAVNALADYLTKNK